MGEGQAPTGGSLWLHRVRIDAPVLSRGGRGMDKTEVGRTVLREAEAVNIPRRGGHGSCHEQLPLEGLLELVW